MFLFILSIDALVSHRTNISSSYILRIVSLHFPYCFLLIRNNCINKSNHLSMHQGPNVCTFFDLSVPTKNWTLGSFFVVTWAWHVSNTAVDVASKSFGYIIGWNECPYNVWGWLCLPWINFWYEGEIAKNRLFILLLNCTDQQVNSGTKALYVFIQKCLGYQIPLIFIILIKVEHMTSMELMIRKNMRKQG